MMTALTEYKCPAEYAKEQAERAARNDAYKSLKCDSKRHGALPGSAWDKWYKDAYQRMLEGSHYEKAD